MPTPELTVVVPAFNEQASIGPCVDSLLASLPSATEIIVVDGGSDRTEEIVAERATNNPSVRYLKNENDLGKGHAIRTGIAAASAPVIVFFDSDLQFYAEDLPRVVQPLVEGDADVALGSRFLPNSGIDRNATWIRNFGNRFFAGYASLLYGVRVTDALAGTKAVTRRAAEIIDLQSDTFEYEIEIIAKAARHGMRIREVAISTRHRETGASKVSIFKVGWKILRAMTHFKFKK